MTNNDYAMSTFPVNHIKSLAGIIPAGIYKFPMSMASFAKRSIVAGFSLMIVSLSPAVAQKHRQWSLADCIDYALNHNISVKQADNQMRQRELQLSTARNMRLPDLSASAGQNFSFGRGLTAENTYSNTNTSNTSLSLGTTVPLFTGFQIPNQIRMNQLNLEAATQDLEKARNDISVQVAQAYVQVLYDAEVAQVAHRQIEIDSLQTVRLQALVDNGKASQAELSQQQATLAQSRLTATQADNQHRMSLLSLSQLLELDTPDGFDIERPQLPRLAAFSPGDSSSLAGGVGEEPSPDAIFAEAVGERPEVRSEQLRLAAADRNISIAKAALYPQLNFSGGLGTNYYRTSGFRAESFGRQLSNNFSQYLGLNLSVPIFNRLQTRNNIRAARVERESQQLQLDLARKNLYKEIQQACYSAANARQKLISSQEALASSTEAFRLMQAKYENGKANQTEFNEAKNNLMKAESDLVQARYEHVYQQALLQFYRGRRLSF